MLGSFIGTYINQTTYHFISKDKKSRTPSIEEFSQYYNLPEEHKTLKSGYWHKNPYQYYVLGESGLTINGVDFGTIAGEPTIATSFETLNPTGVDFASAVGDFTLLLTTSESLIPTGVDFETTVGTPSIGRGLLADGVDFATEVGTVFVTTIVESKCRLGHDLTPFFLNEQKSTNPRSIVKQFTFNNSIFTDRVVSFPVINQTYKDVVAEGYNIVLENASKLMNEIIEDRTKFRQEGEINYGYQFNPSHIDFACIGKGKLINADYIDGQTTLNFKNQMDRLSEINISTDTTSQQGATFVGSTWNPADLTFDILTSNSYGAKLDNTTSTANTDINYTSWLNWKNSLGSESIVSNAFFPFETNYVSALQNIAEITDSAIYVEADNKIFFIRNITGVESFSATVTNSDIIDIQAKGDANDMCNQFTVPISFTVTSNSVTGFRQTISFENTASVNSFGRIAKQPTNNLIWYVDSGSALNLAQRIVGRRRQPELALTITTPIKFLQQQLGDLIYVTHDALNLNEEPYTLIGKQIDIDSQTITMELSVGHGLAVGNFTIFELDDTELGVLDSDAGKLA